jgi:hypothetical protein
VGLRLLDPGVNESDHARWLTKGDCQRPERRTRRVRSATTMRETSAPRDETGLR